MQVAANSTDVEKMVIELASGVDALYCSGRALLPESLLTALAAARKEAEEAECDVDFELGSTPFRMAPRGFGKYRYRLEHEFGLLGFTQSTKLPAVRIQPRAEFIHAVGPEFAIDWFREIVDFVAGPVLWNVSRVDLYVDIQGWQLTGDNRHLFVSRARALDTFEENQTLTGFTFGKRSSATINARVYDKTREMEVKGTDYWLQIWGDARDPLQQVVRVEFEVHRAALREFGLSTPEDVLASTGGLWTSLTSDWLTYRTASNDETRSRWPIAREWKSIQRASIVESSVGLDRVRKGEIAGSLRQLMPALNGYVASFAALTGANDPLSACRLLSSYLRRYEEDSETEFSTRVSIKRRERFIT